MAADRSCSTCTNTWKGRSNAPCKTCIRNDSPTIATRQGSDRWCPAVIFPRHRDVVDACERIGEPRSMRAVAGWSRGDAECSLLLALRIADELGIHPEGWLRSLELRRQVWLDKQP